MYIALEITTTDPVVKSIWCYSRGPKFGSQHPSQEAYCCNSGLQTSDALFRPLQVLVHVHTHGEKIKRTTVNLDLV